MYSWCVSVSGDGRTFVFYYYPNKTTTYNFSCRMKFTSSIANQGHFVTNNKVTDIIEPTPLIKTDKHDYSINVTCYVGFIDIITVFKCSCDNEAIMSESFRNASTSWSVVRLDISKKKTTTLCVCNVSLPTLSFTRSAATQLKYRGRPELLQNEVVSIGNDVVFSMTFYSSEESNKITWYRQWIRLVNSTEQEQTTKQTTLNVLVRGKNVSVEGFESSLLLRNVKEHHLYNIKICVKNHYGISCHRYFESQKKEMMQTYTIVWIIAVVVVVVIVCSVGSALLFYRQRSDNYNSTESTTNPVYYSVDSQQNNSYQTISGDREEAHGYDTPYAMYEHLSEERPLHEYNIPSIYEESDDAIIDVHSFDSRTSYEKIE